MSILCNWGSCRDYSPLSLAKKNQQVNPNTLYAPKIPQAAFHCPLDLPTCLPTPNTPDSYRVEGLRLRI